MATCHGFTRQQIDSLNELFKILRAELSALPPAPHFNSFLAPAPLELLPSALPSEPPHLQSTPAPVPAPIPAQSYPPSPSVETIEEVEHKQIYEIPLRNLRQMRRKHGASKKTRTSQLPSAEICNGWPTKIGGNNMRFSRDEDLDAWYTTMLNHTQKLVI